jgi:hypothetical protein
MKSLKLGLFKTDSGAIFPERGKNQATSLASPGDTRWGYVDLAMPVQVVCNCEDKFDHLVIRSTLLGTFLSLMIYCLLEHFELSVICYIY